MLARKAAAGEKLPNQEFGQGQGGQAEVRVPTFPLGWQAWELRLAAQEHTVFCTKVYRSVHNCSAAVDLLFHNVLGVLVCMR